MNRNSYEPMRLLDVVILKKMLCPLDVDVREDRYNLAKAFLKETIRERNIVRENRGGMSVSVYANCNEYESLKERLSRAIMYIHNLHNITNRQRDLFQKAHRLLEEINSPKSNTLVQMEFTDSGGMLFKFPYRATQRFYDSTTLSLELVSAINTISYYTFFDEGEFISEKFPEIVDIEEEYSGEKEQRILEIMEEMDLNREGAEIRYRLERMAN